LVGSADSRPMNNMGCSASGPASRGHRRFGHAEPRSHATMDDGLQPRPFRCSMAEPTRGFTWSFDPVASSAYRYRVPGSLSSNYVRARYFASWRSSRTSAPIPTRRCTASRPDLHGGQLPPGSRTEPQRMCQRPSALAQRGSLAERGSCSRRPSAPHGSFRALNVQSRRFMGAQGVTVESSTTSLAPAAVPQVQKGGLPKSVSEPTLGDAIATSRSEQKAKYLRRQPKRREWAPL
jgi:hypothetical protein